MIEIERKANKNFQTKVQHNLSFVSDEDEQSKRLTPQPPIKTMTYTVSFVNIS